VGYEISFLNQELVFTGFLAAEVGKYIVKLTVSKRGDPFYMLPEEVH
jgi:hypothetical protein